MMWFRISAINSNSTAHALSEQLTMLFRLLFHPYLVVAWPILISPYPCASITDSWGVTDKQQTKIEVQAQESQVVHLTKLVEGNTRDFHVESDVPVSFLRVPGFERYTTDPLAWGELRILVKSSCHDLSLQPNITSNTTYFEDTGGETIPPKVSVEPNSRSQKTWRLCLRVWHLSLKRLTKMAWLSFILDGHKTST